MDDETKATQEEVRGLRKEGAEEGKEDGAKTEAAEEDDSDKREIVTWKLGPDGGPVEDDSNNKEQEEGGDSVTDAPHEKELAQVLKDVEEDKKESIEPMKDVEFNDLADEVKRLRKEMSDWSI